MHAYGTIADEYYINMNLLTEMELPKGRETILSFFERVQKSYPTMRKFYTRETGDFVLEEDKDSGQQRWLTMEPRRISSGFLNPSHPDVALEQHLLVLELVPYMLTVSPIDVDAIDYAMAFDFSYNGNHDALVAEALGTGHCLDGMMDIPGSRVINYEPSIFLSLDESCRLQARLWIETRTNPYQVRRGEYHDEPITVYFSIRQYGSLDVGSTFESTLRMLKEQCEEMLESNVIEQVLRPLAQAIATK